MFQWKFSNLDRYPIEDELNMSDSRSDMNKLSRVIKDMKQLTSRSTRSNVKQDKALNTTMPVLPPLSLIRNLDRQQTHNLFQELTPNICLVHYDAFRKDGSTVTSPYGIAKERSRSNRCDSGISLWDHSSPREIKHCLSLDVISPDPSISGASMDDPIYVSFPGYKKSSSSAKISLQKDIILETKDQTSQLKYYDSDSVSCTSLEVAAILKGAPGPTLYFSSSRRKKKNPKKMMNENSVTTPTTPSIKQSPNKTPIYMTMTKPRSGSNIYANMKGFQPVMKKRKPCVKHRSLSNFVEQSLDSFLNGLDNNKAYGALDYSEVTSSVRSQSRNSQGSQASSSSNSTLCDQDPSELNPSLHVLLRTHTLYQFTLNSVNSNIESLTIKTSKVHLSTEKSCDSFTHNSSKCYENVVQVERAVYNAPENQDTYYCVGKSRIQSGDILVEIDGTNVLGWNVDQIEQMLDTEDEVHLVTARQTLSYAF